MLIGDGKTISITGIHDQYVGKAGKFYMTYDLQGKAMPVIKIPSQIDKYQVTSISPNWNVAFWYMGSAITKPDDGCNVTIIIPSGVTTIVGSPFSGYEWYGVGGLNNVWVPNTVVSLDTSSFRDCNSVTIEKGSPLKAEFDASTEDEIWGIDKSNITFEE